MFDFSKIDAVIEESVSKFNLGGEPRELYEPIEYMISIGGKRLRPKMALVTYSLFSDKIDELIIYPAIGLEIFHGFTLIHDDIMDNASLRRGMSTVHEKWNNNVAILSGDVMCIKSYEYMAKCPAGVTSEIMAVFSKTAAMVCEGQQYDMNFEERPFVSMDEYTNMIRLKTAVLLAASARIGAIIGGASDSISTALYDYGCQLGLAFQIKDDYFDSFGDSAVFGKSIGGDILCNKKTWLQAESFRVADADMKNRLSALMNSKEIAPQEKIADVLEIYNLLGVKAAAEKEMDRYHRLAIEALDDIPLERWQRDILAEFAEKISGRLF